MGIALGQDQEAIEALRAFGLAYVADGLAAPAYAWLHAWARVQVARSLDRLGRRGEARALLAKQLDRWKDADPDLPLLAEMKGLCARIGCRASSPSSAPGTTP